VINLEENQFLSSLFSFFDSSKGQEIGEHEMAIRTPDGWLSHRPAKYGYFPPSSIPFCEKSSSLSQKAFNKQNHPDSPSRLLISSHSKSHSRLSRFSLIDHANLENSISVLLRRFEKVAESELVHNSGDFEFQGFFCFETN
jgi:hypothetical protein